MLRARDQSEKEKHGGDAAQDRSGGRAAPPEESRSASGFRSDGRLGGLRSELREIRVDFLDRIETQVKTVGANEASGEDGRRQLREVTPLESGKQADRDLRRCGNLFERNFAHDSLTLKLDSKAWSGCSRTLHPSKKPVSFLSGR